MAELKFFLGYPSFQAFVSNDRGSFSETSQANPCSTLDKKNFPVVDSADECEPEVCQIKTWRAIEAPNKI